MSENKMSEKLSTPPFHLNASDTQNKSLMHLCALFFLKTFSKFIVNIYTVWVEYIQMRANSCPSHPHTSDVRGGL